MDTTKQGSGENISVRTRHRINTEADMKCDRVCREELRLWGKRSGLKEARERGNIT